MPTDTVSTLQLCITVILTLKSHQLRDGFCKTIDGTDSNSSDRSGETKEKISSRKDSGFQRPLKTLVMQGLTGLWRKLTSIHGSLFGIQVFSGGSQYLQMWYQWKRTRIKG